MMMNMLPINMFEYMTCGKPIIAKRLLGIMKESGERSGIVYVDEPEDNLEQAVVFLS